MKTSTKKAIQGWRNTFCPKSLKVRVAEWLKENGLQEDAESIEEWATFADFKRSIEKIDEDGRYHLTDDYLNYAKDCHIDSILRDVIFDAIRAI